MMRSLTTKALALAMLAALCLAAAHYPVNQIALGLALAPDNVSLVPVASAACLLPPRQRLKRRGQSAAPA